MTIATLTLNPALDVTTCTEKVRPGHKLRCTAPRFDPGGGGINVARVVTHLGGQAMAVFPSGGPTGATIVSLLEEQRVPILPVPIAGTTRQSFTVDEGRPGDQYRFVLPGPELRADELAGLLDALFGVAEADHVVVSGSLPPGCDPAILKRIAERCHGTGAKLVVDTSGPALAACEGAGAWLIKPSLREVADLLGREITGEADEMAAAHALHDRGFAELVVISLAERGALLVGKDEELRLPAIPVEAKGTVGAGDSMVAGITLASARGQAIEEALRYGIAAGAATLMTPATELARKEDVERLYAGTVS
ncbi:1-phosphofructokinase family hexose kinase [Sphingomonas sp. CBMAI 2297]|uniref:1-phosphofructokinase family hexose kinase n=1 Tax=Sphingomonas sp. CBMAI 2297 TaxID=2991720 RepID=UPI0024561F8C|nr:1-phosphofructokinase family hexose kinase [Sphingomonas sp. CBMAI 2297]MDH4743571.1 1-phosphofructokinase family hexose kinase [Sphingomonas sp. CBMAI 2297]